MTGAEIETEIEKGAIRVGLLNLQAGRGTTDGWFQYASEAWKNILPHGTDKVEAAAGFVKREGIDVMCLCEVDNGSFRSGNVDQVELLSKLTGLKYSHFFLAYSLGVLKLGNAIISRYPVLSTEQFPMHGNLENRVLGKATVYVGKIPIDVFATHLSRDADYRGAQIRYVSKIVSRAKHPAVIAGDFNVANESELRPLLGMPQMAQALTFPTYPSWEPRSRLDVVMAMGLPIKSRGAHIGEKFSDHLPVTAEVYLGGQNGGSSYAEHRKI